MIGYVTIGTNDLESARTFYDAILAPLGAKQILRSPRSIFYAVEGGSTMLAITTPYDKNAATCGNGSMFGLPADTNDQVDEIFRIALANGADDEGAPGFRTPDIYIGYFRDPMGNKLAVYTVPSVEGEFAQGATKILEEMARAASAAG